MSDRNGWTAERRAKQAIEIHQWKPWTRSTGPRTAAGKARAAGNALRIGAREVLRIVYHPRRA